MNEHGDNLQPAERSFRSPQDGIDGERLRHGGNDQRSLRRLCTPDLDAAQAFPAVRSTVEAEPGRVQQLQPRTSLALSAVGSGERTARQPDPRVAERLRRGRPWFGPNHPQAGPLGVAPVHEVERGPRSPPRGANAEARVAHGVRDLASQPGAEEHGEAAARIDGTGPCMGEPYALELGEHLEELSRQHRVRRLAALELRPNVVAEVVDRVIAAPEDPVVPRQAEVVKLVAQLEDPLPIPPPDTAQSLGSKRFGDEYVVVHRDDVPADLPH